MNVTLYINSSDNNRVDKNISVVWMGSGELKNECSVLDPQILIESTDNISNATYMRISEFNKYYFITNIISVRNGLWLISGHVDVLMTYSGAIRGCGAVLARQERIYNLYLDDDKFLVNAPRKVTVKTFPGRVTGAGEGNSFVLTLAGS